MFGDRWAIIEDLPPGGQAYIYLVKDLQGEYTARLILKRLRNKERLGRFKQEIEAALKLDHKNVAKVLAFDLVAPDAYFVTPYCGGGSLANAEAFRLPRERLFDLFGQVCDGVMAAHAQGILHRDIKPDNVFLWETRDGDAVVGDFGLCLIDEDIRLTASSEVVGSRFYTAPELEDGRIEDATPAADVYSLGKVLYWLFSGGRQFMREKQRDDEWDLAKSSGDIYLEHVSRVLDRLLVADPQKRLSLNRLRDWLPTVKRLVVGEFNPIGGAIQPPCYYCGVGRYVTVVDNGDSGERANFLRTGQPGEWRIVVCNYCGHSQTFRPDLARQMSLSDRSPWDE